MSYKEEVEKARKKREVKQLNHDIKTWEENGDQLIGKVVDIKPFTGGKFENPVMQYILDTDEGLISTILGSGTDKFINQDTILNRVVIITYLGKIPLGDGRQCNKFKVEALPIA